MKSLENKGPYLAPRNKNCVGHKRAINIFGKLYCSVLFSNRS